MVNKVMIVAMLVLVIISGLQQNAVGLCACSIALGYFLNVDFTDFLISKRNEKEKHDN